MLSNKPKNLKVKDSKAASWFYEEKQGIEIIVEVEKLSKGGVLFKDYIHIIIPWRTVWASLKRKQAG